MVRGWFKIVPPKKRPPITWELTNVVAAMLHKQGFIEEAVGSLVAFAGMLRVGELSNLTVSDCAFAGDPRLHLDLNGVSLRLADTKTGANQWTRFRDVFEGVGRLLKKWVDMCRRKGREYLFCFDERSFLRRFKNACRQLGLEHNYTSHSLRHGSATFAFLQKVPIETIKHLGRWSSDKSARHYIQDGPAIMLQAEVPVDYAVFGKLVSSCVASYFDF
jgi:integrase